jgi:hypothetical protein
MSKLLDEALDPIRRKACEENDEADRKEDILKSARRNEVGDSAAFAAQQQWLDAMRRVGAI